MRPKKPWPAAVDFGDPPHQADDLGDDEDQVEDGARADRGDERDALGGGGDLSLRLLVEGSQQRPLGDVDEVAPVDDRPRRVFDLGARMRGLRPAAIERDEPADQAPRRFPVVVGARFREGDMHFGDLGLAGDGKTSRAMSPMRPTRNRTPKTRPMRPSDSALANRRSIRLVVHRPKASETRPAKPDHRRPARLKRRPDNSPAFCAASTCRSASSIGWGGARRESAHSAIG